MAERPPIKIPRETSLWIPISRTIVVFIAALTTAHVFAIEIYGGLIAKLRLDLGFAPLIAPGWPDRPLLLASITFMVGCLVALPYGIWDIAEALRARAPFPSTAGRLVLFMAVFSAAAYYGYSTLAQAWDHSITAEYAANPAGSEGYEGKDIFASSKFFFFATKRMVIFGLAALIPVAIATTTLRKPQDLPDFPG